MKDKLFCAIAYNVHDSSVSFGINEDVVLVLEAERFFKEKKKVCNEQEMEKLIKYGLSYLGKKVEDVNYWTMATLQNPILYQREDIFDPTTKLPKDPYWIKANFLGKKRDVLLVNHHLSHGASYLMTDFDNAIIVTCDGGGDYIDEIKRNERVAAFEGVGNKIKRLEINLENSMSARFYGSCSCFLYDSLHCEGKMMALAGFGKARKGMIEKLEKIFNPLNKLIYNEVVKILKETFPEIKTGDVSIQNKEQVDFSTSVQKMFSDIRVSDIFKILNSTGSKKNNLVMAGGGNLNLDTNTEIIKEFNNINNFIPPCCDDTGQSLGALCYLMTEINKKRPVVNLPYLGTGYDFIIEEETINKSLETILNDGILIVHNGKSEIGPRALGNRSLVARPDNINVKIKLSEKIKNRESYRPVAPIVLEDMVDKYFIGPKKSPYMLFRHEARDEMKDRIPGAIHIDGTARVQTISEKDNPFLYRLIKKFGDKTGIYLLLNTSLNLKGDPISNSIDESINIYSKIERPKTLIHNGKIHSTSD